MWNAVEKYRLEKTGKEDPDENDYRYMVGAIKRRLPKECLDKLGWKVSDV